METTAKEIEKLMEAQTRQLEKELESKGKTSRLIKKRQKIRIKTRGV